MDEHETKFWRKILRSRKAEALEWLLAETPGSLRVLGELQHEPALALVRRIYELGAVQVLAVEIGDWAQGVTSNALVIELPVEPAARERLFHLNQQMAQVEGFDGDADNGQRHLFVQVKSARVFEAVLRRNS